MKKRYNQVYQSCDPEHFKPSEVFFDDPEEWLKMFFDFY